MDYFKLQYISDLGVLKKVFSLKLKKKDSEVVKGCFKMTQFQQKRQQIFNLPPFLLGLFINYLCVLDLATMFLFNFSLFVVNLIINA